MVAKNYVKAVFSGPVDASDTWSVGIALALAGGATAQTPTEMAAAATLLDGLFRTNMLGSSTTIKTYWAPATKYTTCSVYQYGAAGTLVAQGVKTGVAVPGTGTSLHPAYTAACVTLLTTTPGRSYRGRIYLPCTGAGLDAAELQIVAPNGITEATKAFFDAINANAWAGTSFGLPVVAVASPLLGVNTPVRSVRCDSLADTQRGRIDRSNPLATSTAALV